MAFVPDTTYTTQPSGGSFIPDPVQPVQQASGDNNFSPDGSNYWGDLGDLFGNGFTDSIRGGAQLLGVKEDEMRQQQQRVNQLLEQHGAAGYAAWIGGMVLDPVGW